MSLRSRMRDVVRIQSPLVVEQNEYGDDVPEWQNGPFIHAVVAPTTQTELEVDRETRLDRYNFIVGNEVTVDATCRVLLADGTVCRIVGTPIVYSTTRGPHHTEFQGEAVAG